MNNANNNREKLFARQIVKNAKHQHPLICVTVMGNNFQITVRDYVKGYTIGFLPMTAGELLAKVSDINTEFRKTHLISKNDGYLLYAVPHVVKHYIPEDNFYNF